MDPNGLGLALPVRIHRAKLPGKIIFAKEGLNLDALESVLNKHRPWGASYYDGSTQRKNLQGWLHSHPVEESGALWEQFLDFSRHSRLLNERIDFDVIIFQEYSSSRESTKVPRDRSYAVIVGRSGNSAEEQKPGNRSGLEEKWGDLPSPVAAALESVLAYRDRVTSA